MSMPETNGRMVDRARIRTNSAASWIVIICGLEEETRGFKTRPSPKHLLFEVPEPRKMASLPVSWIAFTIAEGAAACHQSLLSVPHPIHMVSGRIGDVPVPSIETN